MEPCNNHSDSDSDSSVVTVIYAPLLSKPSSISPSPAPAAQPPAAPPLSSPPPLPIAHTRLRAFSENFPAFAAPLATTSAIPNPAAVAQPRIRGRARSTTICQPNPLETPITAQEQAVSSLAQRVNRQNRREESIAILSRGSPAVRAALTSESDLVERARRQRAHDCLTESGSYQGTVIPRGAISIDRTTTSNTSLAASRETPVDGLAAADDQHAPIPTSARDPQIRCVQVPEIPAPVFKQLQFGGQLYTSTSFSGLCRGIVPSSRKDTMNYQNYNDTPQGSSSNPRQAPPQPSQGLSHANGMNGGMAAGAALVGYPTPAGHQSDLNYVMSMVEELSGVLRMNQQLTANVVDKMGKVREKAKTLDLSNDELIAIVAQEMNEESENLERENSELRKALDTTDYDKKENWKLAIHGAEILANIAEKLHQFKEQHEADTLAWHKNYRKQLADERGENLELRNQINDMKAAACRASEHLRQMRRYITDHDRLTELEIENHRLRTEKRLWKRIALPLILDNDSEWSDDDDLIDPEEKKSEVAKREKERKDKEDGEDQLP